MYGAVITEIQSSNLEIIVYSNRNSVVRAASFADVKELLTVVHDTYYVNFVIEKNVLNVSYCMKYMETCVKCDIAR